MSVWATDQNWVDCGMDQCGYQMISGYAIHSVRIMVAANVRVQLCKVMI